jgi:hydrogenase expression/formation protein HypC
VTPHDVGLADLLGAARLSGNVSGVRRVVNVALVSGGPDGVEVGDWVLIHVGFAISQVDEQEALATRRLLEQLGREYEQELEELEASVIE